MIPTRTNAENSKTQSTQVLLSEPRSLRDWTQKGLATWLHAAGLSEVPPGQKKGPPPFTGAATLRERKWQAFPSLRKTEEQMVNLLLLYSSSFGHKKEVR